MRLLGTAVASACMLGLLGGAAVSAQAGDWHHRGGWRHHGGWHHNHHDWRARRDWRWRHHHNWDHRYGWIAPRPYAYYYTPPPVYYGPPGVTLGFRLY
ncbi:MAG TPA: hypothetical protein VFW75_05120 [Acetobacteraceae bacterium]|nr:hypothetical protein [Acetobacteraceae bacterium]